MLVLEWIKKNIPKTTSIRILTNKKISKRIKTDLLWIWE